MYLVIHPEPILLPKLCDGDKTIMHVGLNLGVGQDALHIWISGPYKLHRERAVGRNQDWARMVIWVINMCPNPHFVHMYQIIE